MGRARKKGASAGGEFSLFDESESADVDSDDDLPRDEAGRAKIKQQYVELLGIRVQKLSGRILNRERINKTLEGIYFVCIRCQKVCHNLDEGLIEDADNKKNLCTPCSKQPAEAPRAAAAPKKPAPAFFDDDDAPAVEAPARKKAVPEAKPAAKPAAKAVAKPAAKPAAKAPAKAPAKPATKPAAKPAAKSPAKPAPRKK